MQRSGALRGLFSQHLRIPGTARSRSSEPEHMSGTSRADSHGSLQYQPFSSSAATPSDYPGSWRPIDLTTTSRPTRLDLIEDPPQGWPTEPTLEEELVLPDEVAKRSDEALRGWNSAFHPIEALTLPPKIDHPGAERYIGTELKSKPKWLWDSHTRTTVLAEDHMFVEGYVAISYTWGRWRDDWRQFSGTPWPVPSIRSQNPKIPQLVCNFDIVQLTDMLCRIPNVQYFWIDVLCINQKPKTEEQEAEKAEEIAKQGAIFKDAKGVLVYLWSIAKGAQFSAAIDELGKMRRWYWQITVSQDFQAKTRHNGREACVDRYAPTLRNDPWFSSLWTLQEMILAPASVWIARDGSHCQANGQVLTTHTVADKFQDFIFRERYYDNLGSASFNPSRNYVQSNVPESEKRSRRVMLRWLKWAFQEASITACVGDSRGGILLATLQRKYTERRDFAVLAALKIGNDGEYDKEREMVNGLAVTLWNELIQAEGGRLFDNSHASFSPLTNMLPTTADSMCSFHGIREKCTGWKLTGSGELKIPRGSPVCQFSERRETEYQFPDQTVFGGDPERTVQRSLSRKKVQVKHVRFITIGYQTPYSLVKGGAWEYTGVRGVILVTTSENIDTDTLWYKAGMFFSRDFRREKLAHDITVGKALVKS